MGKSLDQLTKEKGPSPRVGDFFLHRPDYRSPRETLWLFPACLHLFLLNTSVLLLLPCLVIR